MKKKTLFLMLVLIMMVLKPVLAQTEVLFFEDFEDGDYTNNPVWWVSENLGSGIITNDPIRPDNLVWKAFGTNTGHRILSTDVCGIAWNTFDVSMDYKVSDSGNFHGVFFLTPEQGVTGSFRIGLWYDSSISSSVRIYIIEYGSASQDLRTWIPIGNIPRNQWLTLHAWYDNSYGYITAEVRILETDTLLGQVSLDPNMDMEQAGEIDILGIGIEENTWQYLDNVNLTSYIPEPPSFPPIADPNGPYTVFVGNPLTLDGSGSTDPDDDIVSYLWDLDDDGIYETDAGTEAILTVNYAYLESINLLIDHTYTIHLKVTDSEGQSDIAETTLTILPKPAVQVSVDIKPGGCPNPLNTKSSGVLPVAILGTADLDVTTIDPTSILLAGVQPLRSSLEDVGTPLVDANDCDCTNLGPDGLIDLTLKFETQKIVETIGEVNHGDIRELQLTGILYDPAPYETPIEGADCIVIKGRHKPINVADVNKDGVVNVLDMTIFAQNWLESSIVE